MSECLTTKAKPNKGLKDSYHGHKRCRFTLNVVYSLEKSLTIQNIHLILIDIWTLNFLNGVLERFWRFSVPLLQVTHTSSFRPKVVSIVQPHCWSSGSWRQTGRPEIPQNCSTVIDLRIV